MVTDIHPFGKIVGNGAPCTTFLNQVEDGAEDVVEFVSSGMGTFPGPGQFGLYHRELLSRDVAWIGSSHRDAPPLSCSLYYDIFLAALDIDFIPVSRC